MSHGGGHCLPQPVPRLPVFRQLFQSLPIYVLLPAGTVTVLIWITRRCAGDSGSAGPRHPPVSGPGQLADQVGDKPGPFLGGPGHGGIAIAPLEAVLEPADLPAAGGAREGILIPVVLGAVIVALQVWQPVPRHVVKTLSASSARTLIEKLEYWCITVSRCRQALAIRAQACGVVVVGGRPVRSKKSTRTGQPASPLAVPSRAGRGPAELQHDVADLLPVQKFPHDLGRGGDDRAVTIGPSFSVGRAGKTWWRRYGNMQPALR